VDEVKGFKGVSNKGMVVSDVTVNMGAPIFEPIQVPVIPSEGYVPTKLGKIIDINPVRDVGMNADEMVAIRMPVILGEKIYYGTCVSMGNPHCIVFVDKTAYFNVEGVGPGFEMNPVFPDRVNTEFVEVIDRTHVNMRVWERGSGETYACGTGACATAVACVLNDKTDDEVTVTLLGGSLKIKWDRQENVVYMTGPARTVFEGILR
jgi:diaminopimelate epimerase